MAHRWKNTLTHRDVTPEAAFMNRRQVMAGLAAGVGLAGVGGAAHAQDVLVPNSYEDITQYNNYYEFGTGKDDPAANAHRLTTAPWTVKIDGLVDAPGDYAFGDIMKAMTIEERIYRFRCVEAW
jgi:sulfoxide reductase catalytic subunit YedY